MRDIEVTRVTGMNCEVDNATSTMDNVNRILKNNPNFSIIEGFEDLDGTPWLYLEPKKK